MRSASVDVVKPFSSLSCRLVQQTTFKLAAQVAETPTVEIDSPLSTQTIGRVPPCLPHDSYAIGRAFAMSLGDGGVSIDPRSEENSASWGP